MYFVLKSIHVVTANLALPLVVCLGNGDDANLVALHNNLLHSVSSDVFVDQLIRRLVDLWIREMIDGPNPWQLLLECHLPCDTLNEFIRESCSFHHTVVNMINPINIKFNVELETGCSLTSLTVDLSMAKACVTPVPS